LNLDGTAAPTGRSVSTTLYATLTEQFAVRILTAMYQMGRHLDTIEADENDAARLEQLYRLDLAVNRTRRQAENLLVLAGRPVEDAASQVTTMLDVIRAAASAVEHYSRIEISRVIDLAVVEYAADDLIRVLTELVDNATRFSPPRSTVVVAAHITDTGSVLMRVEDSGFGIEAEHLQSINSMLVSRNENIDFAGGTAHLGFPVIHRLSMAHGLRVQLSNRQPGGVTASIVVPADVLCEIPIAAGANRLTADIATVRPRSSPPAGHVPASFGPPPVFAPTPAFGAPVVPAAASRPGLTVPVPRPPSNGPTPAAESPEPAVTSAGLPIRRPASLRASNPASPAAVPNPGRHRSEWPDDAADFAAGIEDARRPPTAPGEGSR
jgi:hypothetical protein